MKLEEAVASAYRDWEQAKSNGDDSLSEGGMVTILGEPFQYDIYINSKFNDMATISLRPTPQQVRGIEDCIK